MPKYYSFLDDDVTYDIASMTGSAETEQNHQIKSRILKNTPSLKPIATFNSLETILTTGEMPIQFSNESATVNTSENPYVNEYDLIENRPVSDVNTKFLLETIGTSKHDTNRAPAWDVLFVRGDNDTTNNYMSSSLGNQSKKALIPQINSTIEYTLERGTLNDDKHSSYDRSFHLEPVFEFADDSYLRVYEEQVLTRVLEQNGFMFDDSFEIEVFEQTEESITSSDGTERIVESLRPLKFLKKQKLIEKDILLDRRIIETAQPNDPSIVETYFNLLVDEEIDTRDICAGIDQLKQEGFSPNDLDFAIICPDLVAEVNLGDPEIQECPPLDCEEVTTGDYEQL